MNLLSICTRELVTLDHRAPHREAARLMREHHVGSVVVTQVADGHTRVVGILTDRDLVVDSMAQGADAQRAPVSSLIEGRVLHSVAGDADLGSVIAQMQSAGVRRLLVRDADGHLMGIVSFDDVLQACAAQWTALAGVLPRAIEREAAQRTRVPVPEPPRLRVPAVGTAGWAPSPAWAPR
jgi:CBS domain-containing protein